MTPVKNAEKSPGPRAGGSRPLVARDCFARIEEKRRGREIPRKGVPLNGCVRYQAQRLASFKSEF